MTSKRHFLYIIIYIIIYIYIIICIFYNIMYIYIHATVVSKFAINISMFHLESYTWCVRIAPQRGDDRAHHAASLTLTPATKLCIRIIIIMITNLLHKHVHVHCTCTHTPTQHQRTCICKHVCMHARTHTYGCIAHTYIRTCLYSILFRRNIIIYMVVNQPTCKHQ